MVLNDRTNLSVSSKGSVWDSDEEVLSGSTVGLLVINFVDGVDKDDAQVLFQALLVGFELVE